MPNNSSVRLAAVSRESYRESRSTGLVIAQFYSRTEKRNFTRPSRFHADQMTHFLSIVGASDERRFGVLVIPWENSFHYARVNVR